MSRREAKIKMNRNAMHLRRNVKDEDSSKTSNHFKNRQYQPNDFLKMIFEQQKLQQERQVC